MNNTNNNIFLLIASWFNYFLGNLNLEPILSILAYIFSIIGSLIYIYTTIKKYKNEKID